MNGRSLRETLVDFNPLRGRRAEPLAERIRRLRECTRRLSTMTDADLVAAWAESSARSLIRCDEARVTLSTSGERTGRETDWLDAEGGCRRGADLLDRGEVVGRLEIYRRGGGRLTGDDELVLDELAGAAGLALAAARARSWGAHDGSDLAEILAVLSEGVCTLDRTLRIETTNEVALTLLGKARGEVVGVAISDVSSAFAACGLDAICADVLATGTTRSCTARSDPSHPTLDIRIAAFHGGLAVFFRDVTRERETEEKLRQSQKLDAIGQLTGGIAHDVNNMLTVMLGNLEELAERAGHPGPAGGMSRGSSDTDLALANAALRAGESATELMARLVAFARRQPLSPRVVDIGVLLTSLEALLRRTLGEHITLRIACPSELWCALVDPSELESAILNLALNARDAMGNGGVMEIAASNVEVDRVYAAVSGIDRTGEFVVLSVADTGCGMSREVMHRAFDPFFTTKEAGKGTGLGLSMVYGFARQSGGYAAIDSEPDSGTIVRVYLPRSTTPLRARATTTRFTLGGNEKILLVEDNTLVRHHTEAMLRGLGYEVTSVADGHEATERLVAGLRPDLLFSDVVLPAGMTGRDVADVCARLVPGIRVLFTSGYAGDVLLRDGRLPPDIALLNKPFRRSELASCIRSQLVAAPWVGPAEPALKLPTQG